MLTTFREAVIAMPWHACSRLLGAILTSDDWSAERTHLVGRTNLHFIVAVRRVEAAYESLLFRIIADSPDLRHPVMGYVEIRPRPENTTALTVSLNAPLEQQAVREHLGMREAIASLADVLSRTIVAAAEGESPE